MHGTVDGAAIVRGYEYGPGRHVIAQPDELDALRPVQDKALRLERFLTQDQLNPLLFAGRSLYLVPDGPAAEPGYGVLRLALAQRQRWALGRMVLGGHRQVVLVRPADTTLVLHVLHYPEHVLITVAIVCLCVSGIVWSFIAEAEAKAREENRHLVIPPNSP